MIDSLSRLFGSAETTAKCVSMGHAHCRTRLEWCSAAAFQWGHSHAGGSRAGSGNGTRSEHWWSRAIWKTHTSHLPISPSQEVPEVCFGGKAYQYHVLPFCLALLHQLAHQSGWWFGIEMSFSLT